MPLQFFEHTPSSIGIFRPCHLLLFLLLTGSIVGQGIHSQLDSIADHFDGLSGNWNGTSIYITTNKGIYETGEDLWFKTTILDARNLIPSTLDTTLYLQLSSMANDSVVWKEKYEISEGFANGQIYLDGELEEGDYLLAAFSSHSLTKSNVEYNGVRKIKVISTLTGPSGNPQAQDATSGSDSDVQFELFPEGGYLVHGVKCKVAFKAVDGSGKPAKVSGTLYEGEDPLLKFKAIHAGMGSFDLVPRVGRSYSVRLDSDTVGDSVYRLPHAQRRGIALRLVKNDTLEMSFAILSNMSGKRIYVRVQSRGRVMSMASAALIDGLTVSIPVQDFPQGICEVTLLDEEMRPVAERLVYVNAEKKLHISTVLSKEVYSQKEKVTLKIKISDWQGNPVRSHLGISVYDEIYNNVNDGKNILTHYQLSTQLRGHVYNPGYYFDKENGDREEALDLLLLTQGWRRYVWREDELKRYKDDHIVEDGIQGSLTTLRKKKNTPEQHAVMIIDPANPDKLNLVQLDSSKDFYLGPNELSMGRRLYVKHFEANDGSRVLINTTDGFDYLKNIIFDLTMNYPITDTISINDTPVPNVRTDQGIGLDQVLLKGKKASGFRDKYLGKLDSIAKLNINRDYVCPSGILNCEVHENDRDNRKPVEGERYREYIGFEWNSSGSGYTIKGIKNIKYKYPVFSEAELLKKFNLTKVEGYYGKKEFFEPNYDREDDSFPDYRNALFWAPDILTDKNGEAQVEFFCSDIVSHFLGRIEGVDQKGLLGLDDFRFFVNNISQK